MIDLKAVLKERDVSIRECSLVYDIPYATLYDIVSGRADINECKFSTVKKIADFVGIPPEFLDFGNEDFFLFRSNLHHTLKREHALDVRQDIIRKKIIPAYLLNDQDVKAVYCLALVDYIEKKYNLKPSKYLIRYSGFSLSKPFYFGDVEKQKTYIPEFKARNIMEGNLYDAV